MDGSLLLLRSFRPGTHAGGSGLVPPPPARGLYSFHPQHRLARTNPPTHRRPPRSFRRPCRSSPSTRKAAGSPGPGKSPPPRPSAPALAARRDMGKIADAGALTGDLLRLLGFNLNLAPVLDLDHFPDNQNALRGRCWGRDPQRVIDYAGQWNRWLRKRADRQLRQTFPGRRPRADRIRTTTCRPARPRSTNCCART